MSEIDKEYLEKNYRWSARTLHKLANLVNDKLDSDLAREYIKDLGRAISNGWDYVAEGKKND